MSAPEYPADTEAQQIITATEKNSERIDVLTEAVNGLGMNVQWLVDNVKNIFEMFNSPQFASMLTQGLMQAQAQGGSDG